MEMYEYMCDRMVMSSPGMYTAKMWKERLEFVVVMDRWRSVPSRCFGVWVVIVRGEVRFLWMAIMTPREWVREFDAYRV